MLQKNVIFAVILALIVCACTPSIGEDQPTTSTIEISELKTSESLPAPVNSDITQQSDQISLIASAIEELSASASEVSAISADAASSA